MNCFTVIEQHGLGVQARNEIKLIYPSVSYISSLETEWI